MLGSKVSSTPHPVTNAGLLGFPTKTGIILVVSVAAWGDSSKFPRKSLGSVGYNPKINPCLAR